MIFGISDYNGASVAYFGISQYGEVYSWGWSSNPAIADHSDIPTSGDENVFLTTPRRILGGTRIEKISIGNDSGAAICKDGRIVTWRKRISFKQQSNKIFSTIRNL